MPDAILYAYADSPLGPLLLATAGQGLRLVSFPEGSRTRRPLDGWREDRSALAEPMRQLDAYFAKRLKSFDLPLDPVGTPFQRAVWLHLAGIPHGSVTSYGAIAAALGRPGASRAVGAANGANPLPIILPCHRVVGADRSLTGFGGGLPAKRFLLEHEGVAGLSGMGSGEGAGQLRLFA
ncbi:methylated-DNA--[protein]-cysteine S-methyltransferase [Mangrovicella endophytica]|uniref:methylated-DNA--[protein]-cysteine S-methyltransferase n=1 Tax=Mangrovicella endophytica TaxID=2066697 RepID=UPI000C9E278D|nr:methylated-DNA--[protein]-cysteine S-methyltransferase [Mangrovicella endophytica]